MGTQEGDRNWVDVANNLLSRCNVNLKLSTLSECGPDVFVTLYETILGETVPDYIASANSQEDDVHNVQSVIDSLSLDYLQISLSHITGENVVSGDKESIKNLLEIFDGLLEYLNEELNEETQNGATRMFVFSHQIEPNDPQNEDEADESKKPANLETQQERRSVSPSVEAQSTDFSVNHLKLKLSQCLYTFSRICTSLKIQNSKGASDVASLEVPQMAHEPQFEHPYYKSSFVTKLRGNWIGCMAEPAVPPLTSGAVEGAPHQDQMFSAIPLQPPSQRDTPHAPGRPIRAASLSQGSTEETNPDITRVEADNSLILASVFKVKISQRICCESESGKLWTVGHEKHVETVTVPESPEESLAYRRKRNKEAEEELHHISENLSHRLEELDLMLKRVLGESDGSHSSGSVKRTRRKHRGKPDPDKRKASPSPRRERRSAHGQLEEAMAEALSLDDGKQTNLQVPHHSKRGESHHRSSQRKHLESEAYEEELRRCEERERTELQIARRGAQKAEREYREAILRDVSPSPKPSPGKTKTQQKTQTAAQRRFEVPRKTPSLRIRENELLPLLREELPHLHVSPHALGRMWEQQMQQVDKLHAVSSSRHPHHHKLCKQLEEAQRKHDLLVDLVNRDQDHNRRLREFKERIQQQKSVQSKLREQRQQIARAKKYHNDYHVQHRARLMRARTKEEKFRQLFEEGLELQKLRLREQRAYAKEQQLEHQRRQQDQFESLENYYKDQFSLLAEKLAHEREEIQVRKKAQEKALLKMKRELRSRMEREIRDLQKIIIQNDEDDHFQNLEVQRLRNQVHMASFQYNTSYLH
uniref:Centrosomal protein 95 n=1 Tax=Poecilia formosa TaxID=48698 RepID=A0A096MH07_POEFO